MSTIKVNKLEQRTGCTATVGGGAGKTVVLCGSTITLGRCGGTVSLASGASQSGFGRTGTVNWCTTAKTSPFTAVNGSGFFVNTTGGAITVTLPSSPSAGDIIALKDYAQKWHCNAVTLCRNGSKIRGACNNPQLTGEGQSVTLIYVDGTQGWMDVVDSTSNVGIPNYITATGGTITTQGNYKIHSFTSDGTFAITNAPTPANNKVSYMVVAGGAGGGANHGGGGGAGGFREGKVSGDPFTASPLVAPDGLSVSACTSYPVTVGAGGAQAAPGPSPSVTGGAGGNSIFSTITSHGGGGGGGSSATGVSGGSGGGSGGENPAGAGSGNTPPVSPPQGNNGEANPPSRGPSGGGGGATEAGGTPGDMNGGDGATTGINGSNTTFAGGGGGAKYPSGTSGNGTGGAGGGGAGAQGNPGTTATDGTTNTGGGGGGVYCGPTASAAGGSGIVIIRYQYQ